MLPLYEITSYMYKSYSSHDNQSWWVKPYYISFILLLSPYLIMTGLSWLWTETLSVESQKGINSSFNSL